MIDGRPRPNPKAEKWTLRLLGLRGFGVGLRPTVVSSFVGSAATISECSFLHSGPMHRCQEGSDFSFRIETATVEVALHLMGVNGGGGVG